MKPLLAFLLLMTTFSSSVAQFQFGAQFGVNLPASGIALPGFVEVDRDGTQHALIATLGAGINFSGTIGYQFHPNVIANVDFGHFKGFKGGFHAYVAPNTDSKMDIAFAGKYMHITPGLTVQGSGEEGKIQPFARFGIIVAKASVEATQTPSNIPNLSGQAIDKYSGGTSIGFMGAIGAKKTVSDKIALSLELNIKSLTSTPQTLENVQNFNGVERVPTQTFKKDLPPNAPENHQLAMTLPFSSFGLALAMIYQVSK